MKKSKPKCFVCTRTIAITHRHINCSSCPNQAHIKCNDTDVVTYNKIKTENLTQYCLTCKNKQLIKHKCNVCKRTIAKNHRHITCSNCNTKIHIKCNGTDATTHHQHINDNLPINCITCTSSLTDSASVLPFYNFSNTLFHVLNRDIDLGPREKVPCGICRKTIGKKHKKTGRNNF